MHTEVATILRASFGWKADESPEPTATDEFAAANPGLTADGIAGVFESWLDTKSQGMPPPPDYDGTYREWLRYSYFASGKEYWKENTNIALGVVELPVVSQDRIARTVEEWRDNQTKGVSYLGFRLYEPGNPLSVKEWEERLAAAVRYDAASAPWYSAGLAEVYQVLTIEGLLKKWVKPGFVKPSEYAGGDIENFYGSNPQKILDNLHAARRQGNVRAKWLEDQAWVKNPAWRG